MTRDQLILHLHNAGHPPAHLAEQFRLTTTRIGQILKASREAGLEVRSTAKASREVVVDGAEVRVPLADRSKKIVAWAIVDLADLAIVQGRSWCSTRSGYAMSRRADGSGYDYLHRLICPGDGVGDHIDGNKMNCRRSNLRLCSQLENSRNTRIRKPTTTGIKGVCICQRSGRYIARITVNRRGIHLGRFDSAVDAGLAYDAAAAKYFGDFACPNFAEPRAA